MPEVKIKRFAEPPTNKEEYQEYLKTEWWQERRLAKIKSSNYECDFCGAKEDLQVHHKHYLHFYAEEDEDLMTVCEYCHKMVHKNPKWNKYRHLKEADKTKYLPFKPKVILRKKGAKRWSAL